MAKIGTFARNCVTLVKTSQEAHIFHKKLLLDFNDRKKPHTLQKKAIHWEKGP